MINVQKIIERIEDYRAADWPDDEIIDQIYVDSDKFVSGISVLSPEFKDAEEEVRNIVIALVSQAPDWRPTETLPEDHYAL